VRSAVDAARTRRERGLPECRTREDGCRLSNALTIGGDARLARTFATVHLAASTGSHWPGSEIVRDAMKPIRRMSMIA
jgi:hypothetical protein